MSAGDDDRRDREDRVDSRDRQGGDAPASDEAGGGGVGGGVDEEDVRDALRRVLAPPRISERELRRETQRRLREGSGGRFFADGWSTSAAPRATYLVTGILMLVVIVLAVALLVPLRWSHAPPPAAPTASAP
jgi:hypothetical protein